MLDREIARRAKEDEAARRLMTIPGIGPIAATAIIALAPPIETFRKGLPQENCFDLVYRHGLAVDETGDHLAMGSTTGGLWTSANGGEAWSLLTAHLAPIYAVRFS